MPARLTFALNGAPENGIIRTVQHAKERKQECRKE